MRKILYLALVIFIATASFFIYQKSNIESQNTESIEKNYSLDKKFNSQYFGLSFYIPECLDVGDLGMGGGDNTSHTSNQILVSSYAPNRRYCEFLDDNIGYVSFLEINDITYYTIDITQYSEEYVLSNKLSFDEIINLKNDKYNPDNDFDFKKIDFNGTEAIRIGDRIYFHRDEKTIEIIYNSNYQLSLDILDSIVFE